MTEFEIATLRAKPGDVLVVRGGNIDAKSVRDVVRECKAKCALLGVSVIVCPSDMEFVLIEGPDE